MLSSAVGCVSGLGPGVGDCRGLVGGWCLFGGDLVGFDVAYVGRGVRVGLGYYVVVGLECGVGVARCGVGGMC